MKSSQIIICRHIDFLESPIKFCRDSHNNNTKDITLDRLKMILGQVFFYDKKYAITKHLDSSKYYVPS